MSRRHRQRDADQPVAPFVHVETNRDLHALVYMNGTYTVLARPFIAEDGAEMVHLSIKRDDRGVIGDFRVLQRIKTAVAGPEFEAVQVFPRESELVDGANQYHLWVHADPKYRRPFGFHKRLVVDSPSPSPEFPAAKQRRFAQ